MPRKLAWAVPALPLVALGVHGACGNDTSLPVAVSGMVGGGGSTVTTTSGGGGLFPCHDGGELPADVPEGWVRSPCMPDDCEVYFSSGPDNTRPPSPWKACGPGCLELVHDWGDPTYRILEALGASEGATRLIAYTRWYPPDAPFHLETQLVRLPDNEVVFNALIRSIDGPCRLVPHALSAHGLLGEVFNGLGDSEPGGVQHMLRIDPGDGSAELVWWHEDDGVALEGAIAQDFWAVNYGGGAIVQGDFNATTAVEPAWTTPDGSLAYALSASNSALFFTTAFLGGGAFDTFAWDPAGGVRPLVAFGDATEGGACCVASDGTDLVWLEGSGAYDPTTETYEVVHLMASPYATSAAELEPRKVRATLTNNLARSLIVGGGYALSAEWLTGVPDHPKYRVLTRLADGAYWIIPERPGFHWGGPHLYVDSEEFALIEVPSGEVANAENIQPGSGYTIVRMKIADLGPPTPPE